MKFLNLAEITKQLPTLSIAATADASKAITELQRAKLLYGKSVEYLSPNLLQEATRLGATVFGITSSDLDTVQDRMLHIKKFKFSNADTNSVDVELYKAVTPGVQHWVGATLLTVKPGGYFAAVDSGDTFFTFVQAAKKRRRSSAKRSSAKRSRKSASKKRCCKCSPKRRKVSKTKSKSKSNSKRKSK